MSPRLRVALLAGGILGSEGLMVLTGMEPDLALVTAFAVACLAAAWTAVDLHRAVVRVRFPAGDRLAPATAPTEPAMSSLALLVHGRRRDDSADRLREVLVDLVDQQLRATHGIDRRADPQAAAALLAPELQELLDGPRSAIDLSQLRKLDRAVTQIELI